MEAQKKKIPYLNVEFESIESSFEAVVRILEIVRPSWNPSAISSRSIVNGVVNKNTVVYENSSQDETTAIVIKKQKDFHVGTIEGTHKTCQFLHDQNLGCKMLAFFNNGVCMEFVQGQALTWNSPELQKDENWKIVAEKLARWHSKATFEKAKKADIRTMNIKLGYLDKFVDAITSRYSMMERRDKFPTKEEILFEERCLREDMLKHGELNQAFCHMDMHTGNFILQREQVSDGEAGKSFDCFPKLEFIDYDCSGLSFAQYELVVFFYSFIDPSNPTLATVPNHEYQRNFLEHYLRHRNYIDEEEFNANEVEKLFNQVQIARLFVFLYFIVSTAHVCDLAGSGTFIPFVERLWREFHETKENLLKTYRKS